MDPVGEYGKLFLIMGQGSKVSTIIPSYTKDISRWPKLPFAGKSGMIKYYEIF